MHMFSHRRTLFLVLALLHQAKTLAEELSPRIAPDVGAAQATTNAQPQAFISELQAEKPEWIVVKDGQVQKIVLGYADLFTDKNLRLFCPSDSLIDFRGTCAQEDLTQEGLRELLKSRNLEVLMIQTSLDFDRKMLEQVGKLKKLKRLVILNATLNPDGLKFLMSLAELEELSLAWTNLDDASLAELRTLPLTLLDVRRTEVTRAGLEVFRNHPTIRVIGAETGKAERSIWETVLN
jgi:hypothetical protein